MRLIAWDSSSKTGSIGALEWEPAGVSPRSDGPTLVSEWTLSLEASHSDRLLWAVHQMLEASRWPLSSIDYIGVGVGPGSFTGLRIGVTTAKALALALQKPLVGFSSLAALARPYSEGAKHEKGKKWLVLSTTDACKGEVFALWGFARGVAECVSHPDSLNGSLWKKGVEERVIAPEALAAIIKKKLADASCQGLIWVGDARGRYPEEFKLIRKTSKPVIEPSAFSDRVQGRSAALLSWEAIQAGLARSAQEIHPRYVRASDAEIKLKAGLLGR